MCSPTASCARAWPRPCMPAWRSTPGTPARGASWRGWRCAPEPPLAPHAGAFPRPMLHPRGARASMPHPAPMRVLYLTDSLSDLDGVGRYAVRLIHALEELEPGLQVEVLLARKHRPTSA